MPVTMPAASRCGSNTTVAPACGTTETSREARINTVEPKATSMCVRMPAGRP